MDGDMKEALDFIKNCKDSEVLENIKNQINKRLVELAESEGMSIVDKINKLLPLATTIIGCIPCGKNETSPEEMLTDFMDEYMYVVREKTFLYDNIVSCLESNWNEDGIELRNGDMMTQEQYDSILEFILTDVKNGFKGFKWDW